MRQLTQQTRERIRLAEIFAVARRILGHQNDLFDTFFRKLVRFGDDRSEATAAKVPAHLRNEAERTRPIAAFGNFYERVVRRCSEHARRRIIVQVSRTLITERNDGQRASVGLRIANRKDVVDLIRADKRVDFRYFSLEFVTITLN